jgi:alanine racemase
MDRQFGNRKGKVLINGQYAPIVGNVCMDLSMVDVTDIKAEEGDTVVLFGEGLPVTDLAESIGTIPYEILTSVSPRVKRVYIKE